MITDFLNSVYIASPILKKEQLHHYEITKVDNVTYIHDQYRAYFSRPDIYNLEHWFADKESCSEFVFKQNQNIDSLEIVQYYMHRFNITKNFVLLNLRYLQRLSYECNKVMKRGRI